MKKPLAGGATRAFQFAMVAREKGHDVKVFLVDDAIHWAQLGMAEGVRGDTGEEIKPFVDHLIKTTPRSSPARPEGTAGI